MKRIDSKLLKRFAVLASERLTGDWIIVGGTVLPLLGADHRVTIDVDVVSAARDISQAQTLVLMEIAQELGLPVEAVNSAASFYLHQISDHRAHWVEFAKGPRATIYRPDLVLFLR